MYLNEIINALSSLTSIALILMGSLYLKRFLRVHYL